MAKVIIRQVRSAIDRSIKQKRTLEALGLRKIDATVEHTMNDNIRGMIFKVSHLVEVTVMDEESAGVSEEIKSTATKDSPKVVASVVEKDQVELDEEE